MGIAERREREKEALRTRIVEAARDIVSEKGLDALSMRAIAERVEYSPGTLYLYFKDKDELLHEVVSEGFRRLAEAARSQLGGLSSDAGPGEQHRALGRAYARFALEHTAYFRVMFELPRVARVWAPGECTPCSGATESGDAFCMVVDTVRRAIESGAVNLEDARRGAVVSWGLIHGLTSLYLSGHLRDVSNHEEFLRLVDEAMESVSRGWSTDAGR